MSWHSWAEFAAMGGHGLYVWGSFGVVALALAVEVAAVARRRGEALRSLRRRAHAERLDQEDHE